MIGKISLVGLVFALSMLSLCILCKAELTTVETESSTRYDDELLSDYKNTSPFTPVEETQEISILEEDSDPEEEFRFVRELPYNEQLGRPSMLFNSESVEDLNNLTKFDSRDFIVRLQEKYAYTVCNTYLDSANDLTNRYFQYPTELIFPLDGTPSEVVKKSKEFREDNPKFLKRYRFHNESCNWENEVSFWREMFLIAEFDMEGFKQVKNGINNSTNNTNPDRREEEGHIIKQSRPKSETMQLWNEIWLKYENMSVCNQKLLLECDKTSQKCHCRRNGVGLGSVFNMRHVPWNHNENLTSTVHYYDNYEKGKDDYIRIFEEDPSRRYKFGKQCVLTANFPFIMADAEMINPCDLFLPMIGLCQAPCVANASCISANFEEKQAMKKRSTKNLTARLKVNRVSKEYHNKCVCNEGQICRFIAGEEISTANVLSMSKITFLCLSVINLLIKFYF